MSDNSDHFKILNESDITSLRLESNDKGNNLTFAFFTYKPYTDEDTNQTDYYMDDIIVKNGQTPSQFSSFLTDPDVSSLINGSDGKTKKYLTIKVIVLMALVMNTHSKNPAKCNNMSIIQK